MLLTVLVIIVMIVVIVIDKMIKESKWTTNFKNTSMGSSMIKEFEHQKEEATESPEKKYSIDIDTINSAMKISKELAERSIARGMQIQNEDGPQRSWAIAGGMADGLFGPKESKIMMKIMRYHPLQNGYHFSYQLLDLFCIFLMLEVIENLQEYVLCIQF